MVLSLVGCWSRVGRGSYAHVLNWYRRLCVSSKSEGVDCLEHFIWGDSKKVLGRGSALYVHRMGIDMVGRELN